MTAYYLLTGVPVLLALLMYEIKRVYRLERPPYQRAVIWSFFGIYFFLMACRASVVGIDTWNYLSKFQTARHTGWVEYVSASSSEGFALLTKLISAVTGSEQVFLAVTSLLIIFPIAKLYAEKSESPLLTISLFLVLPVFSMFFSGMRQSLAIALVPLAFRYVQEKKPWRFLLVVVLATTFHKSAWLILLLYPVYYMNITRKALLWAVPLLVLVYVFNDQIYLAIVNVSYYVFAQRYSYTGATGAYSMLVLFVILLAFSYMFLGDTDEEATGLRNILVLTVGIQCFALINNIAMRMNYYFLVFLPLLLPKVIRRMSGRNKWFAGIVEFVCCVYFFYYFLQKAYTAQGGFNIFPYVPFWNV